MGTLSAVHYVARKARLEDIPQVIRINRKELPENYSEEFFYSLIKDHGDFCFVAELDGKIIGYIVCRIETTLDMTLLPRISAAGHIVSIAVDSNYRRMGVGTLLMKMALNAMKERGIRESYLEVRIDNVPAISLYEKLGFSKTKKLDFYYADGTSAHIMTLDLSSMSCNGNAKKGTDRASSRF